MKKILLFFVCIFSFVFISACKSNEEIVFDVSLREYSYVYTGNAIVPVMENTTHQDIVFEYFNEQNIKQSNMLNVGRYKVIAKTQVKGKTYSKNFNVTIRKARFDFTLNSATFKFDGEEKSLIAQCALGENYSLTYYYNNSLIVPRNVGTYQVKCVLNSDNYYGEKTATLTIEKNLLNLSAQPQTVEYSGNKIEYSKELIGNNSNLIPLVTYNGSEIPPVNAGIYSVEFLVESDGYYGKCSTTLTVEKKQILLQLTKSKFVYSGNPIDIVSYVTANISEDYKIVCKDNIVNAGEYLSCVTLISQNFYGILNAEIKVEKQQINAVLINQVIEYSEEAVGYIVPNALSEFNCLVTYNGNTAKPSEAGEYAVKVCVQDDNFSFEKSAKLTITKKEIEISVKNTEFIYSGKQIELPVDASYKFCYKITKNNQPVAEIKDAGVYLAKITICENNFSGTKNIEIVVKRKSVVVTEFVSEYILCENFKLQYNLSDSVNVTEKFFKGINEISTINKIGNYSVTLTTNNTNYELDYTKEFCIVYSEPSEFLTSEVENFKNSNYKFDITGTMNVNCFGVIQSYCIGGEFEENNNISSGELTYKSSASYPINYGFEFKTQNAGIQVISSKTNNKGKYISASSVVSTESFNKMSQLMCIVNLNFLSDIKSISLETLSDGYKLNFELSSVGLEKFKNTYCYVLSSEVEVLSSKYSVNFNFEGKLIDYNIYSIFKIDNKNASENLKYVLLY